MRHLLLLIFAVALDATLAASEAEPLEARTFTDAGGAVPGSLPYRFLGAPAGTAPGTRLPLLLCLHGAGERGNDNNRQVGHFKPLFTGENRSRFPALVAIPQVAAGAIWATYGWSTKEEHQAAAPSPHLALAKALVDHLVKTEAVDPQRIYVVGMSMGGYGTWEFAQRWTSTVAAAVPVCGGGDVDQAAKLKALPIWAFHGEQDNVIGFDKGRRTIDAIIAAGGTPKFTPYPGMKHISWPKAFADPALLPWLFAQRLGKPAP